MANKYTPSQQLTEILSRITPLDLYTEMFRRGDYDFIVRGDRKYHKKQDEALKVLRDKYTEEPMYGGAAGGGKSWIGCTWLTFMCLLYPNTNYFIGRRELKRITESTLKTLFKVFREFGVTDYKYNAQKYFVRFGNGSNIDLLELQYKPSDPDYERYGSTEYTSGWIDEISEVDFGAFDVLRTRIGRHMNEHYDIAGKLFSTCNPTKKWPKRYWYDPWKKDELDEIKAYLPALVTDNPFMDKGYIERLKRTTDKAKKERLLNGNWEYDDNPDELCSYDNVLAIFENDHVSFTGEKFITADIARLGSDKAVVLVWDGWTVIDYEVFEKSLITQIQDCINDFRQQYQIPKKNCVADQDGVGGGVVDNCGIQGFVNNSSPIRVDMSNGRVQPNYTNYQVQCGYYLVDKINDNQLHFSARIKDAFREEIIEELGQLQSWKTDDDRKISLLPKKEIRNNIGRSPDWRDALLMRAHFDIKPARRNYMIGL